MFSEGSSSGSSRFTLLALRGEERTDVADVLAIAGDDSRDLEATFEELVLGLEGLSGTLRGIWENSTSAENRLQLRCRVDLADGSQLPLQ